MRRIRRWHSLRAVAIPAAFVAEYSVLAECFAEGDPIKDLDHHLRKTSHFPHTVFQCDPYRLRITRTGTSDVGVMGGRLGR